MVNSKYLFIYISAKAQEETTLRKTLEREYMHLIVYRDVRYLHNTSLRLAHLEKPKHKWFEENSVISKRYIYIKHTVISIIRPITCLYFIMNHDDTSNWLDIIYSHLLSVTLVCQKPALFVAIEQWNVYVIFHSA